MKTKITTMLQAVDAINNEVKDSTLDKQFIKGMHTAETVIAEKLGITETQSFLMALFMNKCLNRTIGINDLFESTKCPTSRKLELMIEIDNLVSTHYILNFRK